MRCAQKRLLFGGCTLGLVLAIGGPARGSPEREPEAKPVAAEAENTAGATRLTGEWSDTPSSVTLELEEEEVGEAIRELARQAGWSLALSASDDQLEQEVTLQLDDCPAIEALSALLEAGDLEAKLVGNVLVVKGHGSAKNRKVIVESSRDQRRKRKHPGRGPHIDIAVGPDERTAIGGSVRVAADEVVEGDAVAVGGSVTVLGRVEGEAVAIGGSVVLEPGAVVEGDATAIGGEVVVPDGAEVEGDRVSIGNSFGGVIGTLVGLGLSKPSIPGYVISILFTLIRAMVLLILGLLLVSFVPDRVQRVQECLAQRPGASTLAGLALMFGFVPLCVLLLVTVVGIALIPVLMVLLAAAMVLGLTAFCVWLGYRIPLFADRKSVLGAMLLGLVVLTAIDLVPLIGSSAVMVLGLVSAGAVLLSRFGRLSPEPQPVAAEEII